MSMRFEIRNPLGRILYDGNDPDQIFRSAKALCKSLNEVCLVYDNGAYAYTVVNQKLPK